MDSPAHLRRCRRTRVPLLAASVLALAALPGPARAEPLSPDPPPERDARAAAKKPAAPPKPRYQGKPLPRAKVVDHIVLYKGKNRLEAWQGGVLLKVYRAAVGKGGSGPKRYSGDNRTPEGRYHIAGRHRSRTYHRFLLISYPNARDRAAYRRARARGKIPAGRGIGSAVGIHGEKRGLSWLPHKLLDWTRGCVAVDNDEIEELYRAVKPRARVVIHP